MQTNNEKENRYIPGVCNIGKEEIQKRKKGAVISGVVALLGVVILLITHADHMWRLLVFFPLASFTIGLQQWLSKFCVGFGMKGLFNFNVLGRTETIEQLEMRKADRSKALKMIITGILAALLFTVAFYMIP